MKSENWISKYISLTLADMHLMTETEEIEGREREITFDRLDYIWNREDYYPEEWKYYKRKSSAPPSYEMKAELMSDAREDYILWVYLLFNSEDVIIGVKVESYMQVGCFWNRPGPSKHLTKSEKRQVQTFLEGVFAKG